MRRAQELSAQGLHYVDVGTSGGVFGLERGYCLMIGGEPAIVAAPRPDFRLARARASPPPRAPRAGGRRRPGGAGVPALRARRRRALREDGAQRHRVRPDGGLRRGLQHPAARQRRRDRARGRRRDHAAAQPRALPVRPRPRRDRRALAARQRDQLLAARPHGAALAESPDLEKFAGRVSDSGEGRWTIQAAIDEGVPAPVLSAALYGRFSSRGNGAVADKVASAMRHAFGGHVEKPANE